MYLAKLRSMWWASMSNIYKTSVTGNQIVHCGVQPKEWQRCIWEYMSEILTLISHA